MTYGAGIVLISDIIRTELSADCSVLMGANVRLHPDLNPGPYPTNGAQLVRARRRRGPLQRPHTPALAPRTDCLSPVRP